MRPGLRQPARRGGGIRTALAWLLASTAAPPAAAMAPPEASRPPATVAVVATFPVLKDFVEQIGRDRVAVTSLLTGLESEHTYTPKPADLLALKNARVLVQIGLGLEVWVDGLIKNSGNPGLRIITTSQGIALIKTPPNHPGHSLGDPHIWLDPENAKVMVRHITEGLIKTDPPGRDVYMRNQAEYLRELDQMRSELTRRLKGLRNRKIITHHGAWSYFARRFGFTVRDTLVPQVGTEPSAKHLARLVRLIRAEKIRVIVSEPQLNPDLPRIVAEESGAAVVVLTPIPGAIPGVDTYRSMIEYDVDRLIAALSD